MKITALHKEKSGNQEKDGISGEALEKGTDSCWSQQLHPPVNPSLAVSPPETTAYTNMIHSAIQQDLRIN